MPVAAHTVKHCTAIPSAFLARRGRLLQPRLTRTLYWFARAPCSIPCLFAPLQTHYHTAHASARIFAHDRAGAPFACHPAFCTRLLAGLVALPYHGITAGGSADVLLYAIYLQHSPATTFPTVPVLPSPFPVTHPTACPGPRTTHLAAYTTAHSPLHQAEASVRLDILSAVWRVVVVYAFTATSTLGLHPAAYTPRTTCALPDYLLRFTHAT